MGTCPSANGADRGVRPKPRSAMVERDPAGSKRGAKSAGGLILRQDAAEEESIDADAVRRTLLSGVQRWCLDVSEWGELSADQWSDLLDLLPVSERTRVSAFLRENDRKLALGSRLLQRAVVSKVFGLSFSEVDIRRTSESKPFFAGVMKAIEKGSDSVSPLLKNWNFNVSHHGKYVVIASESTYLCGVDVVDTNGRGTEEGPAEDYLRYFTDHFTDEEWETIKRPSDDAAKLQRFYLHWGLKEAYVKAIGQGLGYDLRRISFVPGDWVDCCSRQSQSPHHPQRRGCRCPRSVSPYPSSSDAAAAAADAGKQTGDTSGANSCGTDPHRFHGGSGDSDLSNEGENEVDAAGQRRRRSGGGGGVGGTEKELVERHRSGQRESGEGVCGTRGGGYGGASNNAAEVGGGGDDSWEQEDGLGCSCGIGGVTVEVDRVPRPDWSFKVFLLPDGYAATVARGPLSACSPSGREAGVISDPDARLERWWSGGGQSLPQLRFRKVRLEEILPKEAVERLLEG